MNKTENPEILAKAWDVLVEMAREKKTIAYSELGDRIDVGAPLGESGQGRGVDRVLLKIGQKCNSQQIPCLNALCVSKTTGRCGDGLVNPDASGASEHVPTLPEDLERGVIWAWPGIYTEIKNPFKE